MLKLFSTQYKDEEIKLLWNSLEDVLFDEDEYKELVLAEEFHCFEKGTPRNYIWNWFDENHSKGIGYLMWNLKNLG